MLQPMLHLLATAFCAGCGAATGRTERGWRAYLTESDNEPSVTLVCPSCAEARFGEDEPVATD